MPVWHEPYTRRGFVDYGEGAHQVCSPDFHSGVLQHPSSPSYSCLPAFLLL